MYLAVVPNYRIYCFDRLRDLFGDKLRIIASPAHLDSTVKTGIPRTWYQEVPLIRLFGRAYIQVGGWMAAIRAESTVVDLNPRSATAWLILLIRHLLRRRTLTWGHLFPTAGAQSRTAKLRRFMRTLAAGTITYTYNSKAAALADLEGQPVWVAPNSLYPTSLLSAPLTMSERTDVIYVGRLVASKKVDLLLGGFAAAHKANPLLGKLIIVGDGQEKSRLTALASELGVQAAVSFDGWISEPKELAKRYETSFCSVSPGYAGLSLTQSVGFGVPALVSRNERHSPEIELAEIGCVEWFESNSTESLGREINDLFSRRDLVPDSNFIEFVQRRYSAEAMAEGLADALLGRTQLEPEGEV